jgi:hypothetical protein
LDKAAWSRSSSATGRQADQHVARGAEILNRGSFEVVGRELLADGIEFHGLRITHLDQRAAGEVDAEIQAPGGQQRERNQHQGHRDDDRELAVTRKLMLDSPK